jgi:hypothetical protein
MIAGSPPKLDNAIAVIGAAVNKDLVPTELEKILTKILNSAVNHLVRNVSQAEPHLTVELLASLGI